MVFIVVIVENHSSHAYLLSFSYITIIRYIKNSLYAKRKNEKIHRNKLKRRSTKRASVFHCPSFFFFFTKHMQVLPLLTPNNYNLRKRPRSSEDYETHYLKKRLISCLTPFNPIPDERK